MKAVVYNGPWDMTVEDLPKPVPKENEVLVQMEAVGICGSDVHGFTGESGRRTPGMVMGHEAVGKVVAMGTGVTSPQIGNRVIVYNILADVAPTPEEGDPSFLDKKVVGVNLGTCGAMATYLAIPAANAIRVPENLAPEVALLAEPVGVAVHGFNRLKNKNINPSSIAIMGAGTIGLCSLLVATQYGVDQAVILDVIPEKLKRAASFGGRGILVDEDDSAEDVAAKVETVLSRKPDVVIDAIGTRKSFDQGMAIVAEGGALLPIGNLAKEVTLPLQTTVSREITLIGTYGFDKLAFENALSMIPQYQDRLATFIEGRCSLDETPAVMARLAKGEQKALKVVIEF